MVRLACVLAGLLTAAGAAHADTLLLDNGDRLTGQIKRFEKGRYEVETAYAGTVRVKVEHVVSVEMEGEVTMLLDDRSRRVGRLAVSDGRMTVQRNPDVPAVPVDPAAVVTMVAGIEPEDEWLLAGRISVGVSDTAGNSQVRRQNFDGEMTARRDLDRITLNGRGNQAKQAGVETEGNATIGLKYDRFLTRRWYAYAGATAEHDALKELRLRRTFGGGTGFQIFDTGRTSLALEAGLDRVLTDSYVSPDQEALAARLAVRFDHWLVEDRMQFFHYEQNYLSIDALSASFLRTQTGLRLPISRQLSANLQLNVDWDGNPASGRRRVDRMLVFGIGYRW